MSASREALPPKGPEAAGLGEREIDLAVVDALIPCRKFRITYKVAELGKVSLTSEFVLRLAYSVESVPEVEVAAFFGFSEPEVAFVVNDLQARGYIERRNGELVLTLSGRSLFRPGTTTPEIYEVNQRSEGHIFDLISFSPVELAGLTPFEAALPELPVPPQRAAMGSRLIPVAFRRHFETLVRRRSENPGRQSLYSVDAVTPLKRFATPVSIRVHAKAGAPDTVEPDLSDRWSAYELDDRAEIVEAAATLLRSGRVPSRQFDGELFQELARIAPEAFSEFMRDGRVLIGAVYDAAVAGAEEFAGDAPTTLLIGSLFTDKNAFRLRRSLEYSIKNNLSDAPRRVYFWHAPSVPLWGATTRLPRTLDAISEILGGEGVAQGRPISVGVLPERPARYLERTFEYSVASRSGAMRLGALELLLIPGRAVALSAHTAIGAESFPISLGILSFDAAVIRRATSLMRDFVVPMTILVREDSGAPLGAASERDVDATELRTVIEEGLRIC